MKPLLMQVVKVANDKFTTDFETLIRSIVVQQPKMR